MIEIWLFTAKRPIPLVDQTIDSIRKAGFDQKINIIAEPESIIGHHKDIEIFMNKESLGLMKNWKNAISRMTSDWIMLCEDDIEFLPNSAKHITRFCRSIKNPIGYISGYTPIRFPEMHSWLLDSSGWVEFNAGLDTWGTQCILLQRNAAKLFLLASKVKANSNPVDAILGEFFQKANLECYYPFPSLVEHTGLGNSLFNTIPHMHNKGFKYGEEFPNNIILHI